MRKGADRANYENSNILKFLIGKKNNYVEAVIPIPSTLFRLGCKPPCQNLTQEFFKKLSIIRPA